MTYIIKHLRKFDSCQWKVASGYQHNNHGPMLCSLLDCITDSNTVILNSIILQSYQGHSSHQTFSYYAISAQCTFGLKWRAVCARNYHGGCWCIGCSNPTDDDGFMIWKLWTLKCDSWSTDGSEHNSQCRSKEFDTVCQKTGEDSMLTQGPLQASKQMKEHEDIVYSEYSL